MYLTSYPFPTTRMSRSAAGDLNNLTAIQGDDAEFHHRTSYGPESSAIAAYGHNHRRQHDSMPCQASSPTPLPSGGGHGGQRQSSSPIKTEPNPRWGYGSSSWPSSSGPECHITGKDDSVASFDEAELT